MKNLLKSFMLIIIVMTFSNCETESQDIEVDNSTRNNLDNSIVNTTAAGACQSLSSVSKFVNYSMYDTDFVIYDSEGNVLTSELEMTSGESSALKAVNSETMVTLTVRNSETAISKPLEMKICMLYTFVLDQSNRLSWDESEL